MELSEYLQYHENKAHGRPGFRYNSYDCAIPDSFPKVDPHWHDEMEIIRIKSGRGRVTFGARSAEVKGGSVVPILPGEVHSIECGEGRMEYENIIFSLSTVESTDENDWARANVFAPLRSSELIFERPIEPGTALHSEVAPILEELDALCSEMKEGYSS